jgi:electron transfer flavoprotein beta subunit
MRVVVAVKHVLDPDGVNSYALWGRLQVDAAGKAFAVGDTVPRIANAYDEQAMEVALRLRDAGADVEIAAITVGPEGSAEVLKRCFALGADRAVHVRTAEPLSDGFHVAALLAEAIRVGGGAGLVLCGRQGSDYDQGVVPGVLAEHLGAALVTVASAVDAVDGAVHVTRVRPGGTSVVRAELPVVVSVSNEVGVPRYPTSRGMLEARRKRPEVLDAAALVPAAGAGVELVSVSVPDVQGHCEMIDAGSPAATAAALLTALRSRGALR